MTPSFPILKTERFLLKRFEVSDINNLIKGLGNPNVNQYYGIKINNLKEAEVQLEWFNNLEKENIGIWWAICSLDNKVFYGAAGFNDLDTINKKVEVGFWLLEEHWRKGILTALMPLICDYAFNNLSIDRIEGFVETDNSSCKQALAKVGFNYESTSVDAEVKNGKSIDIDTYCMTK